MKEDTVVPPDSPDLRAGEPADREALLSIWRDGFGVLEGDAGWVDAALGGADAEPPGGAEAAVLDEAADVEAFVAVADGDGSDDGTGGDDAPVGFAVVATLAPEFASRYVRGTYPADAFPERTGVIHLLAVDDDHGDGEVGSALTRRCMDWARGRTPMMLVVLWRRPDHVDGSVLAERFDYEEVLRIKGYYRGRREHCPDCGDGCECDATVHVRPLPD